ncbi:MAG TPA: hypothetical protein VKR22_05365 [Acidimicrobiales bacterium]|nr:hypothetical protein [Acidimicrobiales bacterium]
MPPTRSPEIRVTERPDGSFAVEVQQAGDLHRYTVTAPSGLAARLGQPSIDADELVRASFVFLLAREPASSILRSFSLDVIARYFPEYDEVMTRELAHGTDAARPSPARPND